MMNGKKNWQLDVEIMEEDQHTQAQAVLTTTGGAIMSGSGVARRNPRDSDVPMIGDELAVSRALSELSHKLLDTAAQEIGRIEHRRVHLTH
jgi:hypothetical protein